MIREHSKRSAALGMMEQGLSILKRCFADPHVPGLNHSIICLGGCLKLPVVFTLEFLDQVLGMLQVNASQVKVPNPLHKYFKILREGIEMVKDQQLLERISAIIPFINLIHSKHGTFPNVCGTGGYRRMNQ